MKVVNKKSKEETPPAQPEFKFKLGDEVRVVNHPFCGGATGRVVDFFTDQGKYEVWVEIGKLTKSIHMKPDELEKILPEDDLKKAVEV